MNVAFFMRAKTAQAEKVSDQLKHRVLSLLSDRGLPAGSETLQFGKDRSFILNTNDLVQNSRVDAFHKRDSEAISLSCIAVPFDGEVTLSNYWEDIRERITNPQALAGILPPTFGTFILEGQSGVFTDYLGVGRSYYFEDDDFFVASNHIGVCLAFDNTGFEEDFKAWQVFSGVGWFMQDSSPYKNVKRLPPATIVSFSGDEKKNIRQYFNYQQLFSPKNYPNVDRISSEMVIAVKNVSRLYDGALSVDLSGGRDSRVIAAAAIASGVTSEIKTIGSVTAEANVARSLMEKITRVPHIVHVPQASEIKQSISDRASVAMDIWDGDMNPNRLSRVNNVLSRGSVRLGGGGGEIAHGNFYATEAIFEKVKNSPRPIDRLVRSYGTNAGVTEQSRLLIEEILVEINDGLLDVGMIGPSVLDGFYLAERFRRWVAAGHHTHSILIFGVKSFVIAAMAMKPESRREARLHSDLSNFLVPGWGDAPYFKARASDVDEKEVRGLRMWQGPYKDEFLEYVVTGSKDDLWERDKILEQLTAVQSGKSQVRMESTFQKVIWRHGWKLHREGMLKAAGSRRSLS